MEKQHDDMQSRGSQGASIEDRAQRWSERYEKRTEEFLLGPVSSSFEIGRTRPPHKPRGLGGPEQKNVRQ